MCLEKTNISCSIQSTKKDAKLKSISKDQYFFYQ